MSHTDVTLYNLTNDLVFKHVISSLILSHVSISQRSQLYLLMLTPHLESKTSPWEALYLFLESHQRIS